MPRTRMIEEMDAVRIEQNLAEINRLLVGVVDVDGMILDAEVGANALLGFAHCVERVSFEDKDAHRSGLAEAGVGLAGRAAKIVRPIAQPFFTDVDLLDEIERAIAVERDVLLVSNSPQFIENDPHLLVAAEGGREDGGDECIRFEPAILERDGVAEALAQAALLE